MKKIYSLSCLFALPAAAIGYFIMAGTAAPSGFYDGSAALLIAGLAVLPLSILIGYMLRSYCERSSVPYSAPAHKGAWRVFYALMAMIILLNILCRFSFTRPGVTNMYPVWGVTLGFEVLALISIYIRVISGEPEDPLKRALTYCGPCLYFTADLLSRFFSYSVNRNNIPLMFSLLSCACLAIASLRMVQTLVTGETSAQRRFLLAAFVTLVICIGLRLPAIRFYLMTGDLFELVCVGTDCLTAGVIFYEACLTIPSEKEEEN